MAILLRDGVSSRVSSAVGSEAALLERKALWWAGRGTGVSCLCFSSAQRNSCSLAVAKRFVRECN